MDLPERHELPDGTPVYTAAGQPFDENGVDLTLGTVESRIGDAAVRLLSIETILEIKRASCRPKNQAAVPLLEAVLRRRSS
jgi:hypothetical protein